MLLAFVMYSCQPASTKEDKIIKNKTDKPTLTAGRYNVAFLIVDGVFNTELTAPYDIFHHTIFRDSIKAMNVFTVSNQSDAVLSFEGLKIVPDFNFLSDSLPPIDILVVPSAEHNMDSDLEDEQLIAFVQASSKNARYVTSHCDGAFLLAKAGVLDGFASTTFPADRKAYKTMFPQLEVVDSVLFVHDGKYITSAGGAKSFEAALYLAELLYGKAKADDLAKGLVIDWDLASVYFYSSDSSMQLQYPINKSSLRYVK